jgi:GTP-binding protein
LIDAREAPFLDRFFADQLRRAGKPVVLVANKAEGRAGEGGALEAHALGLGEPVAISAEHGEGLADLFAAVVAASAPETETVSPEGDLERPIRMAIVGRPTAANRPWSTGSSARIVCSPVRSPASPGTQ